MITAFASGASAPADFEGFARAGHPVGVAVQEVSSTVFKAMVEANRQGLKVFVDSGAFSAFTKGAEVDFDVVLERFATLVSACDNPHLLHLVAPDIIGDMSESALLQIRHLNRLAALSDSGANIIVPLQVGWVLPRYFSHLDILKTSIATLIPGFAYNKKAWKAQDVARVVGSLHPEAVHLFGVGRSRVGAAAGAIWGACPQTEIHCDSNRVRAWAGRKRSLSRKTMESLNPIYEKACRRFLRLYLREKGLAPKDIAVLSELFLLADHTELEFDLTNTPGFLSHREAAALARFFGVREKENIKTWIEASQSEFDKDEEPCWYSSYGCRLGQLIDSEDPSFRGLMISLPVSWSQARAFESRKKFQPLARTKAISSMAQKDTARVLPSPQLEFALASA